MGLFNKKKKEEQIPGEVMKMLTTWGEHYYQWDGKLYNNDVVRSCIRPKVKAVGKLVAKHIRETSDDLVVNPDAYMRFLLKEPNPYMTGQKLQEKVATQLCLNNNAFVLVVKNADGLPEQLYPIPCTMVETVYKGQELYLKFTYKSGRQQIFPYSDIIHLRSDYNDNDIFGDSPAEAIRALMEVMGTIDQGLVKAIKNSGAIRWLLKYNSSLRPEDLKKNVKEFVDNYLDIESETFGAAGVDARATAERIDPKDFVPNAAISKDVINRIYSFFNTNENIVQSKWTEDEWNAYFEAEVAPIAIEMGDVYTRRLFSRREQGCGNKIVFDANNMQCASLSSKLNLSQMVDRGAMTPNEWRETMNMAPIPGGDQPIRRLDTQVVNMIEPMIKNINDSNYREMTATIIELINCIERSETDVETDRHTGRTGSE